MRPPIRLLIADDHALFREGLRRILVDDPQITIVGMAATAAEVVQQAIDDQPDIILLDIDMPGGGIVALKRLVAREVPTRVILLTGHAEYVVAALHAGASGYLLKDARPAEILDAIHTVAGGTVYLHPAIQQAVVDGLRRGGSNELSERERAILRLVAQGNNNREIGEALGFTEGAVKKYMNAIRAKLGAQDRTHAVVLAKELGLI
jgi:DNA-binding NarL/FixJ family response regulator